MLSQRSLAFRKKFLSPTCCAGGDSVHHALLLLEAQVVRDHGDELAVRGLALDVRHRVAEELLQHLDVAPVPGHLDGVADFRDFRPERGDALSAFLVQG